MIGPDALSSAVAGLDVTQARIDTLTRNISNAQTVGYNAKVQGQEVGPSGLVMALPVQRAINEGLQRSMLVSNGTVSSLTTTVNLLSNLTSLFSSPSSATTVSATVTALQTAYQDLSANPENASLQSSVLNAAQSVASSFNQLNTGIEGARSNALDQINAGLTSVNTTLQQIANVNLQIQNVGSTNGDLTDLQDHLDSLMTGLSKNMDFNSFKKTDGTISIYTPQGQLLVDGTNATPLALNNSGLVQTVPTNGQPEAVTISSGSLGALITARNTTFPAFQTQLDNIASALTQQFGGISINLASSQAQFNYSIPTGTASSVITIRDAQNQVVYTSNGQTSSGTYPFAWDGSVNTGPNAGTTAPDGPYTVSVQSLDVSGTQISMQGIGVPLFNDGGALPYDPTTQSGFSGRISVNKAIIGNPQILINGNSPVALQPGDVTNVNAAVAIFSNNTVAFSAAGLPPTGTIAQAAANFVAGAAVTGQQASDSLTQETSVQQTLQNQISSGSGVNVDEQVAQLTVLQQAYSANARMIQAARDMFSTLFTAVGG